MSLAAKDDDECRQDVNALVNGCRMDYYSKNDPICCCGHKLSEHGGHPAMCRRCTCHQFYQFKTGKS